MKPLRARRRKAGKLYREMTIGLFRFQKQVMWRDLDPKRWPRHAPLVDKELARISDLAVVPSLRDQSPHLDFWGSDVRNDTREGDTLWVNYTTSHFSSSSTGS